MAPEEQHPKLPSALYGHMRVLAPPPPPQTYKSFEIICAEMSVLAHTYNSNTEEAEAGGLPMSLRPAGAT